MSAEVHPAEAEFLAALDLGTDKPVVFDVGANIGGFSAAILEKWPKAQVVCFEPQPEACAKLAERLPDVAILQVALSTTNGRAPLFLDAEADVLASLHKRDLSFQGQSHGGRQIKVATRRLEEFLDITPFEEIDLLKIDAEGHECDVLRGMGRHRRKARHIYFEYNSCALASRTFFKDFWDMLTPEGFRFFQVQGGGAIEPIEQYHPGLEDFVAHRDFFCARTDG